MMSSDNCSKGRGGTTDRKTNYWLEHKSVAYWHVCVTVVRYFFVVGLWTLTLGCAVTGIHLVLISLTEPPQSLLRNKPFLSLISGTNERTHAVSVWEYVDLGLCKNVAEVNSHSTQESSR